MEGFKGLGIQVKHIVAGLFVTYVPGLYHSDINLRENIYEVKFRGNLDTDQETQKKYVYRGSRELCLERESGDFSVIQAPPDFETATVRAVIECIP